MKTVHLTFYLLPLIFILFFSCASQKNVPDKKIGRVAIKDSTEYELVVFDTGFDFWMASNKVRYGGYSNDYYQNANYLYAQEWNRRYSVGDPRINSYLDYNLKTDYGFDFNCKLYMYFKYFEESNKIRLLPGRR